MSGTDPIESAMRNAGLGKESDNDSAPVYRVMADSKIPVSKSRGSLWKSRKTYGMQQMKSMHEAWKEAIRYYNHDQSSHRNGGDPNVSGISHSSGRLSNTNTATENIVFANVNAQLPELYAKNPVVEMTTSSSEDDVEWKKNNKFVRQLEKVINTLFSMRTSPGINFKPTGRRAVLLSLLTNNAWFEVGYTNKDMSSEEAHSQLMGLSKELVEAKTQQEIETIEAKIYAIEEKIEFLRPSGPYARFRRPDQVIVDPDAEQSDLSDANWIMIWDMLPTKYIKAVYGKPNDDPDNPQIMSMYDASHILCGGEGSEETESMTLFDYNNDYKNYGFDSHDAYQRAQRTKVWYVWDKVTRRLELYNDKNWTWPIWVWDDPYKLDQFFPLVHMPFHDNPEQIFAKGEVSYYLDQQDALNTINSEIMSAMGWARRNIFYNSNVIDQTTANAVLSGDTNKAVGINLPPDVDPKNVVFSITPPSTQFMQLFDKRPIYSAIDRIAATNEVMRGSEFKTNTTNQAIDYYSIQGNKRSDQRLDAVEEAIARVGWLIAQLCLNFMPVEMASQLINEQIDPNDWMPIDPLHPNALMSMRTVGGSTTKPSNEAKKREAIQIGQILAQYVKAAPQAVLTTTLRMFAEAFDGIVIRESDWAKLADEITQGNNSGPMANSNGQPNDPKQSAIMVAKLLEQLPPPMLQAIGRALSQGVRPAEIVQQMLTPTNGDNNV